MTAESDCPHAHIAPGPCTVTAEAVTCMGCGCNALKLEVAPVIYQGHTEVAGRRWALFTLTPPVRCPSCGMLMTDYHDQCGGGFALPWGGVRAGEPVEAREVNREH